MTQNLSKYQFWTIPRYAQHHGKSEYDIQQLITGRHLHARRYGRWTAIPVTAKGNNTRAVDLDRLISREQACEITGYKHAWINRLRKDGRLEAYPVIDTDGNPMMWLFDRESVTSPKPTKQRPAERLFERVGQK